MKKLIACITAICAVFCGSAGLSSGNLEKAAAYYSKDDEIVWLSNGMRFGVRSRDKDTGKTELTLISYSGDAEDIIVPLRIDGMTITGIEDEVFKGNTRIRLVSLPDTINYFGKEIFMDSSLTSVNIPKSLRVIPDYTFSGCTDLDSAELHDNILVIGDTAFEGTKVTIPEELLNNEPYSTIYNTSHAITKHVGDWQFAILYGGEDNYYARLDSYLGKSSDLVLPDNCLGVPVIEVSFSTLKKPWVPEITSLVIPASMTEIPYWGERPELKSITFLGERITVDWLSLNGAEELDLPIIDHMSNGAFTLCEALRKVNFANTTEPFYISLKAFQDCKTLEEVNFPEDAESVTIERNAFENSGIKEVRISGPSEIGSYAFQNCSRLTSLVLGGDSHISTYAFRNCKSLKNIVFSGDVSLDNNVFYGCGAIENLTVDTSRRIRGASFNSCAKLMNICSEPAFDSETGDFRADIKDFILENFGTSDDVGFINQYVTAQVKKVVDEYIDDSMSDMQKIKILHDWVCNNTQYNPFDTNAPESHNDSSLWLSEYAVCEGYAKALNLLLHEAGIETYYVHSTDHAWNMVKLGGHYFHIDTTWDDGDKISYDWFLKSDSELKAAGGSHEKWELIAPTSMHSFQGDVLPQSEYRMGDLNTDGSIDSDDLALLQNYILGKASVSADDIVLADLNHDGVTDIFDLICMRRMVN